MTPHPPEPNLTGDTPPTMWLGGWDEEHRKGDITRTRGAGGVDRDVALPPSHTTVLRVGGELSLPTGMGQDDGDKALQTTHWDTLIRMLAQRGRRVQAPGGPNNGLRLRLHEEDTMWVLTVLAPNYGTNKCGLAMLSTLVRGLEAGTTQTKAAGKVLSHLQQKPEAEARRGAHVRAGAAFLAMAAVVPADLNVRVAYVPWRQLLKGTWRFPLAWLHTFRSGHQVWIVAFVDSGVDRVEGHFVLLTLRRVGDVMHLAIMDDAGKRHGWQLLQAFMKATPLLVTLWHRDTAVGPGGQPTSVEEAKVHSLQIARLGAPHMVTTIEVNGYTLLGEAYRLAHPTQAALPAGAWLEGLTGPMDVMQRVGVLADLGSSKNPVLRELGVVVPVSGDVVLIGTIHWVLTIGALTEDGEAQELQATTPLAMSEADMTLMECLECKTGVHHSDVMEPEVMGPITAHGRPVQAAMQVWQMPVGRLCEQMCEQESVVLMVRMRAQEVPEGLYG